MRYLFNRQKGRNADFFLIFRVVTPAPPQKSTAYRVGFGGGALSRLVGTRTRVL